MWLSADPGIEEGQGAGDPGGGAGAAQTAASVTTTNAGVGGGLAGSGGVGAQGGQGGGVGGDAPTAPEDWTAAMDAVYLFEGADPGTDSAGDATLITVNNPTLVVDLMAPQGGSVLALVAGDALQSIAPAPWAGNPNFTYGAWINTGHHGPIIARHEDDAGYRLDRDSNDESAVCVTGMSPAPSPVGSWSGNGWRHVVCQVESTVAAYVNGVATGMRAPPGPLEPGASTVFSVGGAFAGSIDELFFIRRGLSSTEIARIWACGIDGAHCQCAADTPSAYADCGRAPAPCEAQLGACDAPLDP